MSLVLTCTTASGRFEILNLANYSDSGELAAELYQSSMDAGELFYPATFVLGDPDVADAHGAQGMGIDQVWAVHEVYEEHGEAFAVFLTLGIHDAGDPDSWESEFTDLYSGEYASKAEFSENHFRDINHEAAKVMDDAGLDGCVDWDLYWESQLTHDYNDVPGVDATYFFRQG